MDRKLIEEAILLTHDHSMALIEGVPKQTSDIRICRLKTSDLI
jgi:hypothetical protein